MREIIDYLIDPDTHTMTPVYKEEEKQENENKTTDTNTSDTNNQP